jgi:hypothetical protein
MNTDSKAARTTSIVLLIGDILVLALFVFLGETDHAISDPQPVLRWVITTVEFAVPWIIAAWVLGAYAPDLSTKALLGRSLNAWLIAAPMGVLLRSFVNGSAVIIPIFMVVATCIGGIMLLGWRLIYSLLRRSRSMRTQTNA